MLVQLCWWQHGHSTVDIVTCDNDAVVTMSDSVAVMTLVDHVCCGAGGPSAVDVEIS